MVLLDQQHAGELAVSAGGGLEGHAVHAGDLAEIAAGGVQHLPASGHGVLRGQGMHPGEARQGRHLLVDAGVILHGAGAQRIKAAVDTVNVLAQLRVVAAQIHLAELRQGRGLLPPQLLRQLHLLHVAPGQDAAPAAGNALFKDQLHLLSTSFTTAAVSSSTARETFSVAHHRMPPSTGRPPRMP